MQLEIRLRSVVAGRETKTMSRKIPKSSVDFHHSIMINVKILIRVALTLGEIRPKVFTSASYYLCVYKFL